MNQRTKSSRTTVIVGEADLVLVELTLDDVRASYDLVDRSVSTGAGVLRPRLLAPHLRQAVPTASIPTA